MAIVVNGKPRQKSYFFVDDSQGSKRGTRFVTDHRPIETVLRDLVENTTFKGQIEDRALPDSISNDLFEKAGLVVAATNAQAKVFTATPVDRTLVVLPHQLTEVADEIGGITVGDPNIPDYSDTEKIIEVVIDSGENRRNRYITRAVLGFRTWLGDVLSSIGARLTDAEARLTQTEDDIDTINTTSIPDLQTQIDNIDVNDAIQDAVPVGTIIEFVDTAPPSTKYLLIDGSSQLRANYPDLFAKIGVKFGEGGNPGTTFALPPGGVVSRSFLNADPNYGTVGKTGGVESVTLNPNQIPKHTHAASGVTGADINITSSGSHVHSVNTNRDASGQEGSNISQTPSGDNAQVLSNKAVASSHTHDNADFAGSVGEQYAGAQSEVDIRDTYMVISKFIKALV